MGRDMISSDLEQGGGVGAHWCKAVGVGVCGGGGVHLKVFDLRV